MGCQPVWNPAGDLLAYSTNRDGQHDVCTRGATGQSDQQVTIVPATDLAPTWSPDGTPLAFVSERDGQAEIYVEHVDGGQQLNVTHGSKIDDQPSWGALSTMNDLEGRPALRGRRSGTNGGRYATVD